jgi:uncharacterized protein (TIGR02246 family)
MAEARSQDADLVEADGNVVGFDGSPINGQAEIETTLGGIFRDHVTAAYVGKIREVRFLTPEVAVLRAVAGMTPPGRSELTPRSTPCKPWLLRDAPAAGASPSFRTPLPHFTASRSSAPS